MWNIDEKEVEEIVTDQLKKEIKKIDKTDKLDELKKEIKELNKKIEKIELKQTEALKKKNTFKEFISKIGEKIKNKKLY